MTPLLLAAAVTLSLVPVTSGPGNLYGNLLEEFAEARPHRLTARAFDPVERARAMGFEIWDRCNCEECGGWEPEGGGFDEEHGQIATQGDILRAVFDPDVDELWLHGGHGTGKTFILALAAHLWLQRYSPSSVLDTSADFRQVKRQHWKEFRKIAPKFVGDNATPNKTEWELSPDHFALGFSTDDAGGITGYHGARQLFVVNEAGECGDHVFEGANRILTGDDDKLVAMTNTYYLDSVPAEKLHNGEGTHLRLDSTDVISYLQAHPSKRFPGAASEKWLAKVRADYGDGSEDFKIRVHGLYPAADASSLFPPRLIAGAMQRYRTIVEKQECLDLFRLAAAGCVIPVLAPEQIGVDVAGFGRDRTVEAARWGQAVIAWTRQEAWTDHAIHRQECEDFHQAHQPACWVWDASGEGSGTERELSAAGLPIDRFIGQEAPADPERFADRITESYFAFHDFLVAGGAVPPSEELRRYMRAVAVERTSKNITLGRGRAKRTEKVEVYKINKSKLKAALKGKSPDHLDACAQACAPTQFVGDVFGFHNVARA